MKLVFVTSIYCISQLDLDFSCFLSDGDIPGVPGSQENEERQRQRPGVFERPQCIAAARQGGGGSEAHARGQELEARQVCGDQEDHAGHAGRATQVCSPSQ